MMNPITGMLKKLAVVSLCMAVCACSTVVEQINDMSGGAEYKESTQIGDVKKEDVKKISKAGKTTDTDILKKFGKPFRILWTSSGEKAYFYFLSREVAEKNVAQLSIKKIGFNFNDKNKLKGWNHTFVKQNMDSVENGYVTAYKDDNEIIETINTVSKKTRKKNIEELFGQPNFVVNNFYYYFFEKESENKDGKSEVQVVFEFLKNGRIKNMILTHEYYEKAANSIKTDIPVITCDSRYVTKEMAELDESEKTAVALFEQKLNERLIAEAEKQRLKEIREAKANQQQQPAYANSYTDSQEAAAYQAEAQNYQNQQADNIRKAGVAIGTGLQLITTINNIRSGYVSPDEVQNIMEGVNTLISE